MTEQDASIGSDWVSATALGAFALSNPLIDWLDLYGEARGFVRDSSAPNYVESLEFAPFIMGKGIEFEAAIAQHLASLSSMVTIADEHSAIRDPQATLETLDVMREGAPLIHHGVLHEPESRTFGAPDFLVRSDLLENLFPGTLSPEEASVPGTELGGVSWHYVIVDAKFTSLDLLVSGQVGNSDSAPAYKQQLYVYNRALGRLQGYGPATAYLLGRGWSMRSKGIDYGSPNAMDRLGPVIMDVALGAQVEASVDWVRRVRTEGSAWEVLPEPSVRELWPNMKEDGDFPWHGAKSSIAKELDELTMLWNVGPDKGDAAHRNGVTRWTDPNASAMALDVTGPTTAPKLQAMLDMHHATEGPTVLPAHVQATEADWRPVPPLEFFVDFETVSNLNDDFSAIPDQNGQPLIFMIGCGRMEDGAWRFASFTTDALTEPDEERIIDAWLVHMADVQARLSPAEEARVMHWSPAEPVNYEAEHESARQRHPEKGWPGLRWFDLLQKVVREEPVVVRGALGFGLKAVAKAMLAHGLIETSWGDSQVDGLGAMVGAWACDREARERGVPMTELPLTREIADYNEVDCKVMMEILTYLREHH